jgi:hypothetical protein
LRQTSDKAKALKTEEQQAGLAVENDISFFAR